MGHFLIDLSEDKKANVNFGKVKKKRFFLFDKKGETKDGYIINVSGEETKSEYRLFKSATGGWSKDEDGKISLDENILYLIRDAILAKEKELKH